MKKTICMLAALLALASPAQAFAADSIRNPDIPRTIVTDVVPIDPNGGTPEPPVVEITENPPEIEELIEDLQTVYNLTIYYIYWDGGTAAPTHFEIKDEGSTYSIASPGISGYKVSTAVVSGTMPGRNVVYTVIYIPEDMIDEFFTLEDYDTPLGLGFSVMNQGICIE